MKDTIVDRLHQPEYTGENRCEACTVVNLVIAGVVGAVLARKSKLAGTIAVGISLVLIYLRGYLVPGTPSLTKRYLPPSVLRWFGKEPEPVVRSGLGPVETPSTNDPQLVDASASDGGAESGSSDPIAVEVEDAGSDDDESIEDERVQTKTPEEYFLELDVVEPCEEVDDLCLTESFETAWQAAIDDIDIDAIGADDAASAFGFESDDDELEIQSYDEAWVLRRDGVTIGQWPSQAALVADVTAAHVLETEDPAWEQYQPGEKGELLNSLRLFLETCPTGDGAVEIGEETVESCCQSHDVVVVSCTETGERLFEFPADQLEE